MAKEYIEREAAKRELLSWAVNINHPEYLIKDDALHIIDSFPAAEVAPVRHGRWICIRKGYEEYECSVCHGMDSNCSDYYADHVVTEQEYCPFCGAKMDGGAD